MPRGMLCGASHCPSVNNDARSHLQYTWLTGFVSHHSTHVLARHKQTPIFCLHFRWQNGCVGCVGCGGGGEYCRHPRMNSIVILLVTTETRVKQTVQHTGIQHSIPTVCDLCSSEYSDMAWDDNAFRGCSNLLRACRRQ